MEDPSGGGSSVNRENEVNVLWVDDDVIDHTEDAKNLMLARKGLGVELVHPIDMSNRLSELESSNEVPDLFLVDFFLDEIPGRSERKYDHRGLAVAGKIRERQPERPIYVTTQKEMEREEGIFASEALAAKVTFDRILAFKDIQRVGQNTLYFDSLDHRLIREAPRKNVDEIPRLLKVPDDAWETLRHVLPDELREGLAPFGSTQRAEGNVIAFARWVMHHLLRIPGFLYDELRASTYLGMTTESFRELASEFESARYSGVFMATNPSLWWVTELGLILYFRAESMKVEKTDPWKLAPTVFDVAERDLAVCAVCGKPFPETVGQDIDDPSISRPVHYRCSRHHPQKRRELYFDEPRALGNESS